MTDPETTSLLAQAQAKAGELAVSATAPDRQTVEGTVRVSHRGGGWLVSAWAAVKAMAGRKPEASAGVEVSKRW